MKITIECSMRRLPIVGEVVPLDRKFPNLVFRLSVNPIDPSSKKKRNFFILFFKRSNQPKYPNNERPTISNVAWLQYCCHGVHLFCIGAAGLDVTNNSSAPPSWVYGGRRTTESDRQLAGVGVTRTLLSPFSLSRFTWYEYVIIRLWIKVSLVPWTGTWYPYLPPQ